MSIAYIVSAYKLPALLVRLVRRLDDGDNGVFIHVDAKTTDTDYRSMADPLSDRPNVRFLDRHACYWGDFGHVQATLKGLRAALDSGRSFEYFVLLTGQDYPLVSNGRIAKRLAAARGAVFMNALRLPNPNWTGGGMDRIERWHFRVGSRRFSFPGTAFGVPSLDRMWSLPARLLRLRRRFPRGLEPWGGSSYWCVPADCARHVDSFVRAHPRFRAFFRHVHVPDEMFFQTIVMNSPFRDRVTGDNLRYQDWSPGGDHPRILTTDDVGVMLGSGSLFARKFDPRVDDDVLDRLDRVAAEQD